MSEELQKKPLEILWTPTQAAKYLSVSPITVYRWLRLGQVFDPNKVTQFMNHKRIPRSEVERVVHEKIAIEKQELNQQ